MVWMISTTLSLSCLYLAGFRRDGGLKRAKVKDTFKEQQQKMYSNMVVGDDSSSNSDWGPPFPGATPGEPFGPLVEDLHWKQASLSSSVFLISHTALPGGLLWALWKTLVQLKWGESRRLTENPSAILTFMRNRVTVKRESSLFLLLL